MFQSPHPESPPVDPAKSIIRNSLGYIMTGWWNNPEDPRGTEAHVIDGDLCVASIKKVTAQSPEDRHSLLIQVYTDADRTRDQGYLFVPHSGLVAPVSGPYADVLDERTASAELAKTLLYLADAVLSADGISGMTVRYGQL